MFKALVLLAVAAVAAAQSACDGEGITRAIVHLKGKNVVGNIIFTRQDDGKIRVTGKVEGMEPGMYGFHIHEKGDLSEGCGSAKGHFNPDGKDHGHPDDEERHAGDLGNIKFDDSKVANIDFVDKQIALSGRYNVVGRALVLHERHDDYGKTDHPDSKKTGNAGGRVACGVVGIL
uniref:Superoxide dismutase [Cu-Zn] n=1 Tax=Ochrogaster lunifer TaxID=319761 RepID=A0AA49EST1_OCHLU|nr:setae polypeptide [Ochrogaster lunifer]